MNAIELKGLKKSFPDFTLGPVDLVVPEGTILELIGENGAGKSTTIKLMLGLLHTDAPRAGRKEARQKRDRRRAR